MNRGEPLAVRCREWVLVLALRPAHRDNEKSMPTWEESPQAVQVRLRTRLLSPHLNQWDLASSTLTDRKISTGGGDAFEHPGN